MEAKIILAVMKFAMTQRSYLPSTGLPQPFNYRTTRPGSVDRNVVIGNPLSKVGQYLDTLGESASPIVSQVNELGMAELSLFGISYENCWIRGELATRVAEELYL